MPTRLVVTFPLLAGCLGSNTTLADLPDPWLSLTVFPSSDFKETEGSFSINYDVEAFRAAHGGACAVLDDYDLELPGVGIRSKSHGGDYDDGVAAPQCSSPRLDLTIPRFGETRPTGYRVTGGSHTIEATFAADTFAPREPTLASSGAWSFRAGEDVVLTWSHPADLVDVATVDRTIMFRGHPHSFDMNAGFVGDEIRFSIPDPPPITGAGSLKMWFGHVDQLAATCSGATACWYSVVAGYEHSVTITR